MKQYNFDKLNNLPYKLSHHQGIHYADLACEYRRRPNPSKNPYKIATRILDNNIGKSFDMAFHYFCTKVPKHKQYIFLDEVQGTRWRKHYFVDEDGNIQLNKPKHKKAEQYIYYGDYKEELFHKETGMPISKFTEIHEYEGKRVPWQAKMFKMFKSTQSIKGRGYIIATNSDFEVRVVSGRKQLVETDEDRRLYTRLRKESQKRNIQTYKSRKKNKMSESEFRFWLSKETHQERAEREAMYKNMKAEEINTLKILSHGFDPETSFKSQRKFKKNESIRID